MMTLSSRDNPNISGKRTWEDPVLTVERSLVARAQQFGPNSGGADGSSPNSMISPFVQSAAPPACTTP